MYLKTVFVRFYRSFNFDYLHKYDPKAQTQQEWEKLDGLWYPFVRIPIDERITTIVGANESGKTHLLTAIEKGLGGNDIQRSDFCRYSQFFAVEQGKMRWPDFGFEWAGLTREEQDLLGKACAIEGTYTRNKFLLFRNQRDNLNVYLPSGSGYTAHAVSQPDVLLGALPFVFRLREDIGLPESVPIRFLADEATSSSGLASLPRAQRVGLLDTLWGNWAWFNTKETVAHSAANIADELGRFAKTNTPETQKKSQHEAELNLARDLIRKVARIDAEALQELHKALQEGRDAFANSIIDEINDALQTKLNFPHWWVQDRQFRLLVSPREYDLVFTIRDRTETEYAFTERSSGLRYFLSYYIQYLAHDRRTDRREILIMDEPDAYLSNQGQQDLLKIFDAFANPDNGTAPIQVVYVTHSPFLIDKNHGERIRVLEKGVGEEGTRVVRDISRNHYEPLRSAFGSFVGETTFIGNCNLIVEGPADQILLAGAATHLRSAGAPEMETLDLNHITIVPASGASHIPYLVYLARGRDVEKPAVIVMLDSDSAGDDAKEGIKRGGPKRKELLKQDYILQIGKLRNGLIETEDLIPLPLCVAAARRYASDVCAADQSIIELITEQAITDEKTQAEGIFQAIERSLKKISPDLHIEKIGFARAVIETIGEPSAKEQPALHEFEANMKALFRVLRTMQRQAERDLTSERVSARVNRAKASFLRDHPRSAKREQAFILLEEIESNLDNSEEADQIRITLQALRRDFKIDDDLTTPINDYQQFRERLEHVHYAGRLATQVPTLQEVAAATKQSTLTGDQQHTAEQLEKSEGT